MDNAQLQRSLQRVGVAWITFGLLNLGLWLYTLLSGADYQFSQLLNQVSVHIIVVIIGGLLWRGNLQVAHWIANPGLWLAGTAWGLGLISITVDPWGLWLARLYQYPINTMATLGLSLASVLLFGFSYQQLRSQTVTRATAAIGLGQNWPQSVFLVILGIVVCMGILAHSTLYGADAMEAKRLAQTQLSQELAEPPQSYDYHVSSIQWSGNQVSARVIAYSQTKLISTEVKWEKR